MVRLGQSVEDSVTGFKGVVTARCEYLTGCARVLVQPSIKDDGTWVDSHWFDETRVTVLGEEKLDMIPGDDNDRFGADKPAPRK